MTEHCSEWQHLVRQRYYYYTIVSVKMLTFGEPKLPASNFCIFGRKGSLAHGSPGPTNTVFNNAIICTYALREANFSITATSHHSWSKGIIIQNTFYKNKNNKLRGH